MKIKTSKRYLYPAAIALVLIIGIIVYFFFSSVSTKSDTLYIYI